MLEPDHSVERALSLLVNAARVSPPLREAVEAVDLEVRRLRLALYRTTLMVNEDPDDLGIVLDHDFGQAYLTVGDVTADDLRENGRSPEPDPAPDGRCACGGPLTPDGTCPDQCARDTWDTSR